MTKTTRPFCKSIAVIAALASLAGAASGAGFSSGSTGADGAFAPTASITLPIRPGGVYNYTTITIPAGVTVSFAKDGINSPITMLATGDVTIAGTIDIRGQAAATMKEPAGSFLQQGGLGGPGGYAGGRGGDPGSAGAPGQGPGGAEGGPGGSCAGYSTGHPGGGGGGGFAAGGGTSHCRATYGFSSNKGVGGAAYGSSVMLPLVGGSGGGGGGGAYSAAGTPGAGGGGGGGALLLASSGKVTLSGSILAQGGAGGSCSGWRPNYLGGGGGGGSGGIVRILAASYTGGTINVAGGGGGCNSYVALGGTGGVGYASVETPRAGTLSMSGLPSLAITQVGGQAVPANPTGLGDVNLPLTQANPIAVAIAARYIPPGTTLKVLLTPSYGGATVTVNSTPLAGTLENSTASASINVPYGASTLLVQASYALTLAMGQALSVYAGGEQVESLLLNATPGGEMRFQLVTVSGKQFDIAPVQLAMVMPS